jgi:D-sedoheptulose 7-phosphate isomerase
LRADTALHRTLAEVAETAARALKGGGRILACGNGGSMCDATHFAEELSGRFREDRPALAAMAPNDAAFLTCVANDFGYGDVFSRWVEAFGRRGDVLIAISTSGRSPNIVKAAARARELGIKVVALTGKRSSELSHQVDFELVTPSPGRTDRVQEAHIKVLHILVELIERRLYPNLYKE